ncbi:TPA: conjugal transfer protein TraL [Legionella pneumophila]|uniref:PRK13886 family protein n=1 Tax=Legionella pneumophila TaxID=446 RepID=UPI00077C6DA8|nr:ArsA-related P-loop ATPase [Legionella pneumophila]AMQ26652.1 conjugal transfer protein TraL [Legionella pneumophila subsp. pneumophila]PQM73312.1 conjugal transfer protein TraL [Legionella pneumophila]HAT3844131.1 conjugal transfer protein TraL [Legionella pneumophila]HAU0263377.1 conjugal transfer protein TraL [Legionella pneumophila]HAU0297909.1 conjugal transfer protein TraL [Legionella pneumophila]
MAKIHITMQGKGGVGKSFVSATTAQYKHHKEQPPLCIDTDPINATFHGFKALNVERLDIMEGDEINPRHFDALIEKIAASDQDIIIDNGASSFVPLSHYIISNQVPALLQSMGHELIVHSVITGGQALFDTITGFIHLVNQLPEDIRFVVWLNPYWGRIEHEGKPFEQLKVYKENKDRVAALINIPDLKEETFGRDLTDMLQQKMTFNEAINSPDRNIMTKQRLKLIRDQLFGQIDNAMVI